MRKHTVFRPGDIELRADPAINFQTKQLRWMICVNLTVRGVLLECEAQAFFQALQPEGSNINLTQTFVLLNTSESHAGQHIKTVETQTFDARSGDENTLEPMLVGTGAVDYYRVTGISRLSGGVIAVRAPVVTVVFRMVSLMLENG
jgi:hypothetical protein